MYTILTILIILLGKLRDKCGPLTLRCDRPIPWNMQDDGALWMSCCDCGLGHFFVVGHSGTAMRPKKYTYKFRFGANAWTDPDPDLGDVVVREAQKAGIIA